MEQEQSTLLKETNCLFTNTRNEQLELSEIIEQRRRIVSITFSFLEKNINKQNFFSKKKNFKQSLIDITINEDPIQLKISSDKKKIRLKFTAIICWKNLRILLEKMDPRDVFLISHGNRYEITFSLDRIKQINWV